MSSPKVFIPSYAMIPQSPSGSGLLTHSAVTPSPLSNAVGTNSFSAFQQYQQQQQQPSMSTNIREVWEANLEEEFHLIRSIIPEHRYIAMDTEFPGIMARCIGTFRTLSDYQYQLLRVNVDLCKIIQLGLTFMNENGKTSINTPLCWQFNFKFSLSSDIFAQDSIDLLIKAGIQFSKHEKDGIDPIHFAELLMTSGAVLMPETRWISFHSGYDFGYLIKLLTNTSLPENDGDFFDLVHIFFPKIYDVKYLMKSIRSLKGGLQEISDQLELKRIGSQHTAGSDSLLTGAAFIKIREMFFEDHIDDEKYCGHLYGLGSPYTVTTMASTPNAVASLPQNTSASSTLMHTSSNASNVTSSPCVGTKSSNSTCFNNETSILTQIVQSQLPLNLENGVSSNL